MLLSASAMIWLPLALAIMAGFTGYHRVSWGLLIITLLSALEVVTSPSFALESSVLVLLWRIWLRMVNHSGARPLGFLLLWCLALFLHWLHGFLTSKCWIK